MKAFRGNLGARRQGRERDDIGDELHLALERRPRLDAAPGKCWIGRKALSDPFSIGYGELVVCRLKAAVVEQRDLDRRVGGERAVEKAANCGSGGLGLLGRADSGRVLVEFLLRERRDHAHARIWRKPGASRKQGKPRQMGEDAKLEPECLRDRRSAGGAERPNMYGHELLDCRWPSGALDSQPRAPTLTTDSQTMGGRLMRSGPRPLKASPKSGKTTEARL